MQPDDTMPPEIEALWEKYLAQPLTDTEAAALLAWLEEHPNAVPQRRRETELSVALEYMFASRASSQRLIDSVQARLEGRACGGKSGRFANKAMARIVEAAKTRKSIPAWPFGRTALGLAATFLLVLLGAILWRSNRPSIHSEVAITDSSDVIVESGKELALIAEEYIGRKVVTQDRARARLRFKDSTTIELKENTQIRIGAENETTGKLVETLQGLLEVNAAPQPKERPLKLHSAHGTVTVFGTVFWMNVVKKGTSVDLLDGNVILTRRQDNATLQLKAGQRSVISPDSTLTAAPLKLMNGKLLYNEEFDAEMKNWRSAGGQLIVREKRTGSDENIAKMLPAKESLQTSATLDFQKAFARTPDFFAIEFTMNIGKGPGGSGVIHFAPTSDAQGTAEDAFDPSSEKPRRSNFEDRWRPCRLEISQTRGIDGEPILIYRSYINGHLFEAKRMRGRATGFRITHNDTFSIADFQVFERSPSGSSQSGDD